MTERAGAQATGPAAGDATGHAGGWPDERTVTRRTELAVAGFMLTVLLAATACAGTAPAGPSPTTTECVVVDDAARSRITIGVAAAAGGVDVAASSAARLAGTHLHETLVRVDCTGAIIGAIADEWSSSDGRHWRFRIARGGTFVDGTPLDAHSIISAWSAAPSVPLAEVTAAGQHDLRVTVHTPGDARLFALPELAVVRTTAGDWPTGTGPYAPDSVMPTRLLRLVARGGVRGRVAHDAPRYGPDVDVSAPDTIDIRTFGSDLRTAIDAGVDALVTGDPATLAYARARSDYASAPLPWNRTYVLASAPLIDSAGDAASAGTAFPEAVVRVAARPALGPFWWHDCRVAGAPAPHGTTDGRVLYSRVDPIARAIAERITALARDRAPGWLHTMLEPYGATPSAVGVSRPELLDALRARTALAIVMSLSRWQPGGCGISAAESHDLLMSGWHVMPLIDTRDHLIYRPGIGRVVVDADGLIRFGM